MFNPSHVHIEKTAPFVDPVAQKVEHLMKQTFPVHIGCVWAEKEVLDVLNFQIVHFQEFGFIDDHKAESINVFQNSPRGRFLFPRLHF